MEGKRAFTLEKPGIAAKKHKRHKKYRKKSKPRKTQNTRKGRTKIQANIESRKTCKRAENNPFCSHELIREAGERIKSGVSLPSPMQGEGPGMRVEALGRVGLYARLHFGQPGALRSPAMNSAARISVSLVNQAALLKQVCGN